jgi:hypothetical protein
MNPLTFVGIGEVLFDVFEDGTETLGEASVCRIIVLAWRRLSG